MMKPSFISLLFAIIALLPAKAQSGWAIYLGDDMDTLYTRNSYVNTRRDSFFFSKFVGYDLLSHLSLAADTSEEVNRAGIILEAKSTRQYIRKGEIIFGNGEDSVQVNYRMRTDVVTHGRSAALSILNLFSKKEDKIKQEEPYDETGFKEITGDILYGGKKYSFHCSGGSKNKQTMQWLLIDSDTLRIIPAQQFRKTKNGKIKTGSKGYGGTQLMKGRTCLAATDINDEPPAFYLIRNISAADKLIITVFFMVSSLEVSPAEFQK